MDTAGLREAKSGIEREGIRRTIELAEEADIFLLVEDSALPSPKLPESIAQRLNSSNCIVIRNKVDLGNALSAVYTIDVYREVAFSALTGEGLDELKSALIALIDSHFSSDEDDLILVNARHNAALAELKDCLSGALAKFETDDAVELIASDMRGALDAIGAILGRIDNEAMLDVLFSSFCIGK